MYRTDTPPTVHPFAVLVVASVLGALTSLSAVAGAERSPTPAERQIVAAQNAIAARPDNYRGHNDLALALARRARETADGEYYRRAEEVLAESLRLAPDNLEAQRLEVWLLLGQHDFTRALEAATRLNRRMPDDLRTYALLSDANVQLGNYAAAEEAVQWMLDLRPGSVPALSRGAHLREIFGDLEGALDWMDSAYRRTRPSEVEDRAWLLTQIGHLELERGAWDRAERALRAGLELFPRYHYALAEMADLRLAQGELDEAVELRRRHSEAAPHPENFFYFGEALALAGRAAEAEAVFGRFEELALEESAGVDNANGELVRYYLEFADRPEAALGLAEREVARRRDVATLTVWARALLANGQTAAAAAAMAEALAPGGGSAEQLFHAARIAAASGDRDAAASLYDRSLQRDRRSRVALACREALDRLDAESAPSGAREGA